MRLRSFVATRRFFAVITLVFIIEALWLAFTSRYPMAYDEDIHFGTIKLYAEQWLPFFGSQPAGADQFGAVVRDPLVS